MGGWLSFFSPSATWVSPLTLGYMASVSLFLKKKTTHLQSQYLLPYCISTWNKYKLCNPMDCKPARLLCLWNSPGKNTGAGCHALLQGVFPTQGSCLPPLHLRLLHWQADSLPLRPARSTVYVCLKYYCIMLFSIATKKRKCYFS